MSTTADRRLIEDLEDEVRDSSDQFAESQETTGIRPPPQIEVTETQTESTPFGGEFGQVSTEPGNDCPECEDCPPGTGCDFTQTATGAVSGSPATLVVCTPNDTGWVPIT